MLGCLLGTFSVRLSINLIEVARLKLAYWWQTYLVLSSEVRIGSTERFYWSLTFKC